MPGTWRDEATAAVGRLKLGNPQLEAQIQAAHSAGRVRLPSGQRDLTPAGPGRDVRLVTMR